MKRLCLLLLTLGCADITLPHLRTGPPELPPPPLPMPEPYDSAEGSLWKGDQSRRFLAFENRAKSIGDLITVKIDESAIASNQAKTELDRSSTYEATLDSDIALQTLPERIIVNLLGILGFTKQQRDATPTAELEIVSADTATDFEGEGKMSRTASFTTTVACLVTDISPSGLMKIEGQRHLQINRETEIITVAGYVRPEDVKLDNTIASTLIASADISYGGHGLNAEQQRAPWLKRVFDVLLPF